MPTPRGQEWSHPTRHAAPPSRPRGRRPIPSTSTELLAVLTAVRKGDFSVRMPVSTRPGLAGKIADTLNDIIELNQEMARELERVSMAVGKEGKIAQRATAGAGPAAPGRRRSTRSTP